MRRCLDDRGSTALEMALVAPTLLLVFLVLVETMMTVWLNSALESGVRVASRFGMTGYASEGMSRERMIIDELKTRTMGLVDERTAVITMKAYGDFSQIEVAEPYDDAKPRNGSYDRGETFIDVNGNGRWDPDMGRDGAGGPGEVVVYTVRYNAPYLTPLQHLIGGGGFTLIQASAVVRNEPFPGGS